MCVCCRLIFIEGRWSWECTRAVWKLCSRWVIGNASKVPPEILEIHILQSFGRHFCKKKSKEFHPTEALSCQLASSSIMEGDTCQRVATERRSERTFVLKSHGTFPAVLDISFPHSTLNIRKRFRKKTCFSTGLFSHLFFALSRCWIAHGLYCKMSHMCWDCCNTSQVLQISFFDYLTHQIFAYLTRGLAERMDQLHCDVQLPQFREIMDHWFCQVSTSKPWLCTSELLEFPWVVFYVFSRSPRWLLSSHTSLEKHVYG